MIPWGIRTAAEKVKLVFLLGAAAENLQTEGPSGCPVIGPEAERGRNEANLWREFKFGVKSAKDDRPFSSPPAPTLGS